MQRQPWVKSNWVPVPLLRQPATGNWQLSSSSPAGGLLLFSSFRHNFHSPRPTLIIYPLSIFTGIDCFFLIFDHNSNRFHFPFSDYSSSHLEVFFNLHFQHTSSWTIIFPLLLYLAQKTKTAFSNSASMNYLHPKSIIIFTFKWLDTFLRAELSTERGKAVFCHFVKIILDPGYCFWWLVGDVELMTILLTVLFQTTWTVSYHTH